MANWRPSTWGDEVTLEYGKALRDYSKSGGKYRVYGSNGPIGWTTERLADGPGIILGRKGAYRGVRYSPEPYFVIDTAYYVVPKSDLDMRWLYYAVIHHKLGEIDDGSPIPSTTRSAVYVRDLAVPCLDEQRAIGTTLGTLDDKIDLNRRISETLEAIARAIFKDWFVDFGPTRAMMEGRAPYLAPDLWALFPDRLDDAGNPAGWETGTLADLAKLNPESWSRSNYPDAIRYVDLAGTKWGTIEAIDSHSRQAAPSRAQRVLRPGDTIVGLVRPGNGSYAFISEGGLTGSTGFAVLRPIHSNLCEALYLGATKRENIERLAHLADGAAYPAVGPDVVLATEITIANGGVMEAFSKTCRPFMELAEVNKREARTLAATRDALLPKLMSGEVRMKNFEKRIGGIL